MGAHAPPNCSRANSKYFTLSKLGKRRRILLVVDDQARLAVQCGTCRCHAVGHDVWVLLLDAGIADFGT